MKATTIKIEPGALDDIPPGDLAQALAAHGLELVYKPDGLMLRRRAAPTRDRVIYRAPIVRVSVNGQPLHARVTWYTFERPMDVTGWGYGDADPPEPEELEYELLDDENGKPAPWIWEHLSEDERNGIHRQILAEMRGAARR